MTAQAHRAPSQPAAAAPALVLSGGGSRGAYQAGCWKALHESGFRPALVVGTSVGALNGALIVAGTPPDEMRRWWARLRTCDLIRLRRDVWRLRAWNSLHDADRLRRLLEANLDLAAVRTSKVPLVVTATDLGRAAEATFEAGALTVDHFMATTALMPGLAPVRVDGRPLADGGHWNAFPVHIAVARGHRRIVGLLHDPIEPHAEPAAATMMHQLRRLSDVAWHAQQAAALALLRTRTRLPPHDPEHLPPFVMELHAPEPPLANLILRFEPAQARAMFEAGYAQTRARIG